MEEQLAERIVAARADGKPLRAVGHSSKLQLLGDAATTAERLPMHEHSGITMYSPEELVVTAKAGTPMAEILATLGERRQMLAFDPPLLRSDSGTGTAGGAVAAGLSGPGRPWRGSIRDAVLGLEMVNGEGEHLRFGGQVMKNVAGYDVQRLLVGSRGIFGVITSVTFRVAPVSAVEQSYRKTCDIAEAVRLMRAWARQPLPLNGLSYAEGALRWRLSGHASSVNEAAETMAGDPDDDSFWHQLRDFALPLFRESVVWRQDLPPASTPEESPMLIDRAGARRWYTQQPVAPDGDVARLGSLPIARRQHLELLRRIKKAFDPGSVFAAEPLTGERSQVEA